MASRISAFLALWLVFAFASNAHAQVNSSGELYFKRNCASCHSVTSDVAPKAGPGLFGLVGRKVGSAPKFNYSDALTEAKAKGTVWSQANLDTFLSDPSQMLPGTYMPVRVASKSDRTQLIAYLAGLKGGKVATIDKAPVKKALANKQPSKQEVWIEDRPGKTHRVTLAGLPRPFAAPSAGNPPHLVPRPEAAMPIVPAGFKVNLFANDPDQGRLLLVAPNGDVFLSEPNKGQIKIMRSMDGETATTSNVYVSGLSRPFGMAFYPSGDNPAYLYVATVNSVVRIPYASGDLKATGTPETVVDGLTTAPGAHTTRSLVFSNDDKHMFVSIGSATNVADTMERTPPEPTSKWEAEHGLGATWGDEENRADVIMFDPDGSHREMYATGLRNCVGLIVYRTTGDLLCSVNERDELGDDLPPDYLTRVTKGAFYGWPWYYIGANEDPRLKGARPDLRNKVTTPDTLIQPHSAPLGMAAYRPAPSAKCAFPKAYEGDVFLALHGSWNRAGRTGSKVVRVMFRNGKPTGEYQDFMTGFVLSDSSVWGRPSSIAVAKDGALLVADDAGAAIWRVSPAD